jgi:hypothetical protein
MNLPLPNPPREPGVLDSPEVSRAMNRAAYALGMPRTMLEILNPAQARQAARERVRIIEGLREILNRQADGLEEFLALLDRLPAVGTIKAGLESKGGAE